jgi:hypothetical protein
MVQITVLVEDGMSIEDIDAAPGLRGSITDGYLMGLRPSEQTGGVYASEHNLRRD